MRSDATTRRRLLQVGGGIAIVSIAGCVGAQRGPDYTPPTEAPQNEEQGNGEGQTGAGGDGGPERSQSATVDMVSASNGDQIFDPEVVWLEVGGTVTFVNESGAHSATAYAEANDKPDRIPSGAEAFDSGLLSGESAEFDHTFEVEGVYDYYCIPHEAMGMIGTVVVGDPDPDDEPGLAPPQDSLPGGAADVIERLNGEVREQL